MRKHRIRRPKKDSFCIASRTFTTKDNTVEQWVALGRTLERMLLCTTQVGIANAYLNQPNEESGIAKEMAKQLQIPTEYPTVLIRLGYGKRMLIA